jgi:hypothetical protein
MRKGTIALFAVMMLPFAMAAKDASALWGKKENSGWGTVIVKDGYPFKRGSIYTTKMLPNCEDSDGNVIRGSNCQHIEPNTKGWASHFESMAKSRYGSNGNKNPSFVGYILNGTALYIAQGGDPTRDMLIYNKYPAQCQADWQAANNDPNGFYCKLVTLQGTQFVNVPVPGGGKNYGGDPGIDGITAMYDPVQDRYFEFYHLQQWGWNASITSANPGVITTLEPVNNTPVAHKFKVGDVVHFIAKNLTKTTGGTILTPNADLPTNIVEGTEYYISSQGFTETSFEISATPGGDPIDTTAGVQSGYPIVVDQTAPTQNYGASYDNASAWDGIVNKAANAYAQTFFSADPRASNAGASGDIGGTNAGGTPAMATAVSVAELQAGSIQHAIGLVIPEIYEGPQGSGYQARSYPATKQDFHGHSELDVTSNVKWSDCSVPTGSRMRLDPDVWTDDVIDNYIGGTIDVGHPYGTGGGYGTPAKWVKTVMKAVRDYGLIINDTGSNWNIRLQNPGFKGVIDYNGNPAYNEIIARKDNYTGQYTYSSISSYNQYPDLLPGDPYFQRDGKGIFTGTHRGAPGAGGGSELGRFPIWALQLVSLDMNNTYKKPRCNCADYTGLGDPNRSVGSSYIGTCYDRRDTTNRYNADPVITSATTATGTAGQSFTYSITGNYMTTAAPTTYGATGLPSGLSIDTSTGVISGTPSGAGTSSITLSATNSFGYTGTKTLTLTVN